MLYMCLCWRCSSCLPATFSGAPPPSSYLQALQQEGALSLVLSTLEPLETRHLLLPVSFVSRLITTAQEAFAVQFVQVRLFVRFICMMYCSGTAAAAGLLEQLHDSVVGCSVGVFVQVIGMWQ
jgi:hypothetical protein